MKNLSHQHLQNFAALQSRNSSLAFVLNILWELPSGEITLKGSVGVDRFGNIKDNNTEDLQILRKIFLQLGYSFELKEDPPSPQEIAAAIKLFQIEHFGAEGPQSDYGWMSGNSSNTLKKLNELYIGLDGNVGIHPTDKNKVIENKSGDVKEIRDALIEFGYVIPETNDPNFMTSFSVVIRSFQTTEFGLKSNDWPHYGWLGKGGGTIGRINKNRNELKAKRPKWRYIDFVSSELPETLLAIQRSAMFVSSYEAVKNAKKELKIDDKKPYFPTVLVEDKILLLSGPQELQDMISDRDINNPYRIIAVTEKEIIAALSDLNREIDFTLFTEGLKIKVPTPNYWIGKELEFDKGLKIKPFSSQVLETKETKETNDESESLKDDDPGQTTLDKDKIENKDEGTIKEDASDALNNGANSGAQEVIKTGNEDIEDIKDETIGGTTGGVTGAVSSVDEILKDVTSQTSETASQTLPGVSESSVIGPEFKEIDYKASKINVTTKMKSKKAAAPVYVISDTVGLGKTNKATDVETIQNALRELGYTITIPDTDLKQTIKAIKAFQLKEYDEKTSVGYLGPTGGTIKRINKRINEKRNSIGHDAIVANRKKDFTLKHDTPGKNLPKLTQTVGKSSKAGRNVRTEVIAVQAVLANLGMYENKTAGQKEIDATKKLKTKTLTQSQVKETIKAIKKFQGFFRVNKLVSTTKDKNRLIELGMDKDMAHYEGSIQPNDGSYIVLKSYTRQKIAYRDYKGDEHNISLGNFKYYNTGPNSAVQKRDMEHAYQTYGELKFDVKSKTIDTKMFEHIGLTSEQGKALMWVSQNEGGIDAVNTYDGQVMSVGFSQLAGGGAFEKYVAYIKHREPELFFEYFKKYGIDVDYTIAGGEIADGATFKVYDVDTKTWKEDIGLWNSKSFSAKKEVRENPELIAAFIRSAQDPRIQAVQIETTYRHYVEAAHSIKITLPGIGSAKMKDLLTSEIGLAALYDWVIHRWTTEPKNGFNQTYKSLIAKKKLTSLKQVKALDEVEVLKKVNEVGSGGGFIKGRIDKLLLENTADQKTKTGRTYKHHRLTKTK